MNSSREVSENDKRYTLLFLASCIDKEYQLEKTPKSRARTCKAYVDMLRRCHRINLVQWEIGMSLAESWYGTSDELLQAMKDLSK